MVILLEDIPSSSNKFRYLNTFFRYAIIAFGVFVVLAQVFSWNQDLITIIEGIASLMIAFWFLHLYHTRRRLAPRVAEVREQKKLDERHLYGILAVLVAMFIYAIVDGFFLH